MSVMDAKLVFSDNQAVTTVGAAASTNALNIGEGQNAFGVDIPGDAGEAGRVWLNVVAAQGFESGGAATLKIDLQDSDTDTAGDFADALTVLPSTGLTGLAAGTRLVRMLLPPDLKSYLRLNFTVVTADFTAGRITAWLGLDPA